MGTWLALQEGGPCHLGGGCAGVGDDSDGQQAGGLWEVQPSHGRLLLSHICRVTHGQGSVAPGLGKVLTSLGQVLTPLGTARDTHW